MRKQRRNLICENIRVAKELHPTLSRKQIALLRELTAAHGLSLLKGELRWIDSRLYVSHSGLLRIAKTRRCTGIDTAIVRELSEPSSNRWVFRAVVQKCDGGHFSGYGDADPSSVTELVRGAELRVAETRAVNRALRKAYGIGICSVEEIRSFASPAQTRHELNKLPPQSAPANGKNGSGPRVRDQLCQLIRKHQLDPVLVKSYAVDFCGTKTLRDATREQVENFVSHLADWAEKDRNALLCQLNSYLPSKEGAA
jgi:hypothetical protein